MVLVAMLGGCLEPGNLQHCGTTLCPSTNICIDGAFCVAPGAICADGDVGAACNIDGVPGRCVQHDGRVVCERATCGDGVIDQALNEQCDGQAAFDEQCVDRGYDLGRLSCTDRCEFDEAPCIRFGWEPVINAPIYAMWTDGKVTAYGRYSPSSLRVTGGDYNVDVPGSVTMLAGGGPSPRLLVIGQLLGDSNTNLWQVDPAGVTKLQPSFSASKVAALTIDDEGTAYALTRSSLSDCVLYKSADGQSWTSSRTITSCVSSGSNVEMHLAVTSSATQRRVFYSTVVTTPRVCEILTGGQQCHDIGALLGGAGTITQLASRDIGDGKGEALYIASGSGLARIVLTGTVLTPLINAGRTVSVGSLAFTSSAVFAANAGILWRWNGNRFDQLRAPAGQITDDGHGTMYAYPGPIYRYSGMAFGELGSPPIDLDDHAVSSFDLAGGRWFASKRQLFWTVPSSGVWAPPITNPLMTQSGCDLASCAIRAVFGLPTDHFVMSSYPEGAFGSPRLWYRSPSGCSGDVSCGIGEITPPCAPAIDGLWMPNASTVFAAGQCASGEAFLGRWNTTSRTWTLGDASLMAGCELHALAGVPTDVVAAGACNGHAQLWHFDGTSWTRDQSFADLAGPFHAVQTFTDGTIFAVGDYGAAWRIGGQWHSDATITGRSISGSKSDLWVAGAFTEIQHWDGSVWSRMTTRSLTQTVIFATPDRVLMPGGAPGHVALVREP